MADLAGKKTDNRIEEQYLTSLFRLAFNKIEQENAAGLIEADLTGEFDENKNIDRLFQGADERIIRRIDRRFREIRIKDTFRRRLPKVVQIAAAVVLIAAIGGAAVIASSKSVRVSVLKFLIEVGTEYTKLSLIEDDTAAFDVPMGWNGDYFLSFIPEAYSLTYIEDHYVVFEDENDNVLTFSEYAEDSYTNIDTEGAEIEYVNVSGRLILLSKKDGLVIATWSEHRRYFVLHTNNSTVNLLEIAANVKRIK